MTNNKNESVKKFEQYAESRLKENIAELNTRYENEKIDRETLDQAFEEHRKMYSQDLDGKIQHLLNDENTDVNKVNMDEIKKNYLQKFDLAVKKN